MRRIIRIVPVIVCLVFVVMFLLWPVAVGIFAPTGWSWTLVERSEDRPEGKAYEYQSLTMNSTDLSFGAISIRIVDQPQNNEQRLGVEGIVSFKRTRIIFERSCSRGDPTRTSGHEVEMWYVAAHPFVLACVFSMYPMLFVIRTPARRRRRWREQGRCVRCGYDLRMLPIPRCPECGSPFDAELILGQPDSPSAPAVSVSGGTPGRPAG